MVLLNKTEEIVYPSDTFFKRINENFEKGVLIGSVQIISDGENPNFYIFVKECSLIYAIGEISAPTTIINMKGNVLNDLIENANIFDLRLIEFSSRLEISGNIDLGHFLLNLIKTPSASILETLDNIKKLSKKNRITKVQLLKHPDINQIQWAMDSSQPLVITSLIDEWDISKWNLSTLKACFGKYKFGSSFKENIEDFIEDISIPKHLRSPTKKYINGAGLPGIFWKDFPIPKLIQDFVEFPRLWIGDAGETTKAVTGLHCDCHHGFLCQVFGRKKVVLYSPDQEEFLYPVKAFNQWRQCWTGPDCIDYEAYPLFKNSQAIEVTLNPGDTLFIPFGWFHCVFAIDPVMSISFPVVP